MGDFGSGTLVTDPPEMTWGKITAFFVPRDLRPSPSVIVPGVELDRWMLVAAALSKVGNYDRCGLYWSNKYTKKEVLEVILELPDEDLATLLTRIACSASAPVTVEEDEDTGSTDEGAEEKESSS